MTTIMRLKGGVPILMPYGKLIGVAASQFREKLISQMDASDMSGILIDFKQVNKIDSSGLGTLVEAYIIARREKGRIGVINVGMNIKSLIIRTRLINIFEHFDNEDIAVAILSNRVHFDGQNR